METWCNTASVCYCISQILSYLEICICFLNLQFIAALTLKQGRSVEIIGTTVYKRPAPVGTAHAKTCFQKECQCEHSCSTSILLKQCSICHGHLVNRIDEDPIECTIGGSESFEAIATYRKICSGKTCRATHRANFAHQDGVKKSTLSLMIWKWTHHALPQNDVLSILAG